MNTSSKTNLIFFFKTSIFPKNLVNKDCLKHKDFLFSEFPVKPDIILKQNKYNLADCFIPRKDEESVDDLNINKALSLDNISNKNDQLKIINSKTPKVLRTIGWKRGENAPPKDSPAKKLNFVDDPNSKISSTNENILNNNELKNLFQRAASNQSLHNNEDGQSHNNNVITQDKKLAEEEDLEELRTESLVHNLNQNDIYNANRAQMYINNQSVNHSQPNVYHNMPNMQNNGQFMNMYGNMSMFPQVKTDYIMKVCEYLNLNPDVDPLWYIFHPISQSSFGPVTTKQLIDTCNLGIANSVTDVRLIDLYSIKGYKPYNFFKLQNIEREDFVDYIEDTLYLKNTDLYKQYKILELNDDSKTIIENTERQLYLKTEENLKIKEKLASLELEYNLLKEVNKYSLQTKNNDNQVNSKSNDNLDHNRQKGLNSYFPNYNNKTSDNNDNIISKPFLDHDEEDELNPKSTKQLNKYENNAYSNSQFDNSNSKNVDTGDHWEVKQKKKRPVVTNTNNEQQLYSISSNLNVNKKKNNEVDKKSSNKIDLIGGDALVDLLNPALKHKNQEAEKEIINNSIQNESINNNDNGYFHHSTKSKKSKGKPIDLDIKLGK